MNEPAVVADLDDVGHDDGRKLASDAAASDDIEQREKVFQRPVQQGRLEHLVPDLEQRKQEVVRVNLILGHCRH